MTTLLQTPWQPFLGDAMRVALIGIGATALMDLWLWGLKRLGVPSLDLALIGRWVGHGFRGRWRHLAIGRATPVRGERALGWSVHYGVGVAFAAAAALVLGGAWVRQPTAMPALLVGVVTAAAPLFVMQPALGAGVASSRTPTPLKNTLKSLASHTVFGAGLYLSALAVAGVWQ